MAELADLNPEQIEEFRRYVSQAKQEARSGNLEESIQLFQQALEIHSSEKLTANIKKLEEALASLAVEEEEDDDDIFVDVCQSGLMLYGEMHDKLFDYQREGVAFLYQLYRNRRKGGILADDMGLGKTIQVIAFLSGMFDAKLIRSVLLILPASLLNNWVKEFAKWTPGLRVKVFHGSNKAERNRSLERIQRRKGILLTTYQMLLNSWPQLSSFGGKEFVWDYIILDEAHKIKTPSAKTTKSVNAISSKNRILLTGTPVQNNLKELWALFDFACQGSLLGTSKTFRMEYENPITRARAKDATPGEKALGLKISENLMSIIKPYFLRRTKDELQKKKKAELPNHLPGNQSKDLAPTMPSLPRKNEFIIWAFLSPIQEEIYRNFISLDHIKELLLSTRSPLAELTVLKQLCDHPRLLSNRACSQLGLEASDYSEQDVGENDLSELPDMKRSIGHVSDEMLIQESGKLSFLVALLERLQDEGHRTLVFSLSRKTLDIIEHVLTHRGFKLMRIDGTVTQLAEREKRIGMFQKDGDYSVFLLTTQVGGVGLTLTAASRVVIFDPSWNPAIDAQAVDRAYRIGQKENVIIYRLITCGTVEEKIYRRQVFKDSLMRQSTGDKKNPYRYFTVQELKELFILEDTRSSATQLQLQSLHATQRKTDTKLDEHTAYLHALDIFGISDHDLMYTCDTAHDEAENEDDHRYVVHRVQIAQELVQRESQLNDQHKRNIRNTTEGTWVRNVDSFTQPKTKPSRSSSSGSLGPSMSERTNPTVVASPIPSMKKSPTPLPMPVAIPPVFISPVHSNEVIDLTNDDDNDVLSDMVNLSSKMTSLVVDDMGDEQMLQTISNTEDALPSEEKEQQFPSFQACELKPGTGPVSPFQTHPVSNKEDYSPESSAISALPAQDKDGEQLVLHTINTDVLHFKNKEYQPTRLQADEQNVSLNVVSSLLQGTSLSIEGSVNSKSKMISCDPSPEARNELKDVHMKLLQDSIAYPSDDDMHQTQADMSLDVLPITHGDACKIKELDAVAPQKTMLSEMTESSALQKPDTRETVQFQALGISSHYQQMRNIRNTTEGPWVRDIDSSTQPKTKPSKSSSDSPLGPSTSERTNPTVVASPIPSMKKSPIPLPTPVVFPPVFISPVHSNEVIDFTSDDDNDVLSDMVNLSSKMTSLVVDDMGDEQMLQTISNTEDALPSEEKEQQFPSFQACELKPGTGPVSPFQTHPVSNKEDYSPESSAISALPAQDKDGEQLVLHTINTDVLHFKNKEYQPTRLQADEQNESLNVVSSLLQGTSLSIKGSVNSKSKMISCDPSPEARNELKDVHMKLLQDSIAYPSDDDMHQTQADMSLDVLPITHGDACKIKELDAVAPQKTMLSEMTESSALQKPDTRETVQFQALGISSHYQVNFNLALEDSENGPQTFAEKDMSLEETENVGFQLSLDSYCSSATESIGREHGSHRSLQTSNGAEGSVVMDDSNGPCDSRDSFGLGKKKHPAIIVSDEEKENDELIDELDEDKPEGICMSTPTTNRPMAAIYFSPRVKLSGRRSTASRRSLFDLVLEEVEGVTEEAGSKDVQMKLLQDSTAYPDDDMHQTQADMSLEVLPITHGDACKIKELDAVAPQETMVSKMSENSTLQKSDLRETVQFKCLGIFSQHMRNIRNTTEGPWVRDIDSSTQPKTKPSKSSSDSPLGPSTSERTNPTVVASPIPSMKKSPIPLPTPVVFPPVFISPVHSNEVIDFTSDDDNDVLSDMVNLSSKMTSLVVDDMGDEQMLQTISNTEDALPSEEKEQQFPSFQACELKPGTGPVSPFQTHPVSNKEDYSPESSAISALPAQDKDGEQLVLHTINTDVLHFKNKEYQPTRLQADEQNKSLNVVSSLLQGTSLSIEGSVNSKSKMISCDPSPEARNELKDVHMKLLQDSIAYPSDDDMHQTQADMSLDVLPITHGDACKIKELDAVAPQKTMLSEMTESSALQKPDTRETVQFQALGISSHYQVNFNLALEDSENGPQTFAEKDMSLEETENVGFQLSLDSYCSSATESIGREHGSHRSLQTSNGAEGSVVMDDSNGPCDSRDSFGLGKKKHPAIIVSDEEKENDELIDELDEDKPEGICMSTPTTNRPMAAIYFSPRVKLSGRRSTASRRSLFDLVLEEVEGVTKEAGSKDDQMKLLQDSTAYPDDDMHKTQADMSLEVLPITHGDACKIKELDAVAPQETMVSKMSENSTLQKSDLRETAQFKCLGIFSQHMRNIRNTTEGPWVRDIDSSTQPKTKPSKSSSDSPLGPSTSERTNPTVVASPIPSMKKSPIPLPTPVVFPPVFISPVHSNEVIDFTSDDDNDVLSDMVNLSSKMTSLVVDDMGDEQMLQTISNTEDALPSEEKEQQFPSFQACELKPGTGPVSPFQTHPVSNKEDYSPESSAISALPAQDKDGEQLVLHTINTDVLHFKNKEYQPTRLQADEQNESLNVVSSLLQGTSLSIEGSINSKSKMISCDPSPEARNELKDVHMKLLQDSIAYPSDDDMHQTQADMSLDVLPITHGDACKIKELDAVAPQKTMLSEMTESSALQKPDTRETVQFQALGISSHYQHMRNIRNTTEGPWVRDIDSSTQPKTKPSKSSSDSPLGPSTSERTNPTVVASPIPSMKKSPIPLPTSVVFPPVFISPVHSNEVIDFTSDDDNDVLSDMVNLSSKMTSLVVDDMGDEQMLQTISNTEDALPSEEKEQQFPSFQACELKPGTGPVSPFQTHPVSNKEDYSPESSAISALPAQDKDGEQLVLHTINTDVLHFKNKEYQPTRLQADEQNKSLNVVSSLLQGTSLSIEGSVNSKSKMISCDPSPEARNELKDVHMKLLQDSIAYPSDDDMHQTQADMSLDVLPITHGDACKIKELDAVAPQKTMLSEMTESSALQKPDTRETVQFQALGISSHYQVNFNLALEDSENGPQTFAEKDMSLEETENVGFQLSLDSYCSSATESIGREHGSHRSLQTSNGAEGSVVMDDSNGPCDSRDSFGLGKKKHPAIIVSDEEKENDELIDELDEDKPEGICMSTPTTNRPMAAIYFSPRVKLSGRRSTASRRSLFDLVLEEVEGVTKEAGSKDDQMKLLQDSTAYPDDDMHKTQADMSLEVLPITHGDACKIKELDAVAPQETMVSKMSENSTLQKSDLRETAQFKCLGIFSQHMRNIRNTTEGPWVRDIDSSTQPKTKPSKSSSDSPLGPSTSERTNPTVVASPIPSMKKSPIPLPTPVVFPPVFISPVHSNEVIDFTSDDDNDVLSDMVNLSSKMTSLVVDDMGDEQMLQTISNTEDALPSEEKEQQFPSFQACELKPGTGPVSPFQTHPVSNKEDYSPESSAISALPAQDKDGEQLVLHTINTDVLHFKNKEYQPTRLQADEQNESLNVVSSLLQGTSLSIEGSINSKSKMISCDPSPEARNELKDVHMKLLQDSIAYPSDDDMHQTQADMSLDVLPITHGDACKIKELDAVAPQKTMLSEMTESSALQKPDTRETVQFQALGISSHYQHMRNIRNTTEGPWVRDIDSSTQPKTKPSKSSSDSPLGPSTSERTNPTVVASPIPSMKKSPIPLPTSVVFPPVFISPVHSNEVIDFTSDDDNDVLSDMVNFSSKMTSLVVDDMGDEQMLQTISNTEDALPSEEKEQQFPSFQACELKPGTGPVSPFQTHPVSNKEDYSPESSAISALPAQDKDGEQLVLHTINTDVLHFKNKEYQPTRLQADEQNESLNVVSSLLQGTSLSIEGSINSKSKMISCDPSPEARNELKDVHMKLLQDSIAYPSDDDMHQTQADMSLDVLPITHGDACKIKELDAVAPQKTMLSEMTESSALQKPDTRETVQFQALGISSHYQVNFNLALEDSENGPQTFAEKDMSLEETENVGFQLSLDSYCSSATESIGREHGSHRSLQTSNGAEGSVVMDDSNGPCDSRDSFGLGKKKHPAIIVSDEEKENDELIDELDEDKPEGICMSTPTTNRPMAAIYFSPRVKLSGRRSTASRRSLFDLVLEEVEGVTEEAGSKDDQMKLLQDSTAYPDDDMHKTQADMSLEVLPITHGDACKIKELDAVAPQETMVSKMSENSTLQKSDLRETAQFKCLGIFSQHMRNIRNTTEGPWVRDIDSSTQPKTKPSKSSSDSPLGPSTSERTNPTVVASPIPSMKKSPIPLPTSVVFPPVFISPVHSNEVIDFTSDDDNDVLSDMVNLSSKMTSLVVDDMGDEQMLQTIFNTEDAMPSEEKEQQFPSFQACELKPGTGPVSPFQTHPVSNKEDYSPESSAISALPAQDKDGEKLVLHTINTDVLHFKNKEYQPTRLQADEQNESLNVVSSLLQGTSLSIEGSVNSESKMISCDPSPEARNELKDVHMKLLQDSIAYPSDDDMHQTQADMSLDVLPITHGDACKIKELDAVAPQKTMLSEMTESSALQKPDTRETVQFQALGISSHYQQMRNIRNTTEGPWVRDIDSSTQPKTKPSKSSSDSPLGPSTSERTNPTVVASPIPSMKKSPIPLPTPVVFPPVFISPVHSNKVIDFTSDDDNDVLSDMVNLSSKMTSLVVDDMGDEQMLQTIFNTEDAMPSEEKEQQFPSFQACELKPGTGPVSPFQTHPVSNKEDYSPESSAISALPAQDKDGEKLVLHTINTDVLHFKNKEYQPTRLQADEQNESLNVVSSLLQGTSLSIEGSVNSESKMISCDPSPEARNELKDVHMKLLQDSIAYPSDDDMHQTQADMSLDVLPITHGDACKIKELDAVAPQKTMLSEMTESSALQKPDTRETVQFQALGISSHYQVNFNLALEDSENGPQTFAEKDMSLEETENVGFQLSLDSYCSSATESIGREHGSHRSLQTSNGAEGSVVMDDSNGPCDSRNSFGLGKKKHPAIIVSDEEKENDELIDELDEDKPEGICMSTPTTNRPMAAIYFSPRVKLSGRRSTASRRSLFDLVLEEVEDVTEEAGSKDDQMKLLQDSTAYPDDDMHQTQADMSLEVLPITHGDACKFKELDAVAPQETMVSKMSENSTLQKSDLRETAQFKSLGIFSQQMRNIRNTTEGPWVRDIDSSTQPKTKPSKSSSDSPLGPSTSERTNPTVVASPIPSMKKSPIPLPTPVVFPPVFISPVHSNKVIDFTSDDDNDVLSDMVNLSSKMTSLVVDDMGDEQMLQTISNTEDALPSEEKEQQFPSFQANANRKSVQRRSSSHKNDPSQGRLLPKGSSTSHAPRSINLAKRREFLAPTTNRSPAVFSRRASPRILSMLDMAALQVRAWVERRRKTERGGSVPATCWASRPSVSSGLPASASARRAPLPASSVNITSRGA
ncbi:uncharacterized protein [Pituophis catenifer annectens]|uniref:uncharacterized protein n=1 Tax=Pituophis catenifer annectens TaxID=94852 RepID=UPI003994A859